MQEKLNLIILLSLRQEIIKPTDLKRFHKNMKEDWWGFNIDECLEELELFYNITN